MIGNFSRHIFRFILCLWTVTGTGMAQEDLVIPPNNFPLYKTIRNLQLQNNGVRVKGLTLQKDAARICLLDGDLWFFAPVDGKTLGAVFIGRGDIKLDPATVSEKKFMSNLTGGTPFAETFNKLALFFVDDPFRQFTEQQEIQSASPPEKAQKFFTETTDLFRKGRKYDDPNIAGYFLPWNIHARLLYEMLNPPHAETFFLAAGEGDDYGDFLYIEDPLGVPGHAPEEVALLNLSKKNLGSWYAAHFKSHYQDGRPRDNHPLRLIDVERYSIKAKLDGPMMMAWTAMFFTPLQDNLSILPLDLDSGLRVLTVHDQYGNFMNFIQEEHKEDGNLSVIFPEPLEKGKSCVLHFYYAGDESITDQGNGNFSLVDRSTWYPNPGMGAYNAKFDLEFDIPAKTRIYATGDKVSEKQDKGRLISIWKSKIPLKVAGFNYGVFQTTESIEKASGYRIETCANEQLPNRLAEIQILASKIDGPSEYSMLLSLNTLEMMKLVHAEAEIAVNTYSTCFGQLPYDHIAITQQPFYTFGQAWPTLIFMPLTAFLPEIQKEIMGVNRAYNARTFFRLICAHEVAHQWWGHWIGCSNYRDQWLSEGLAVFSSALFAQRVYGIKFMNKYLEELKEQLIGKNRRRVRPIETGSVDLGYRLDTEKTGACSYAVIYGKGCFILHMLRMLMWEPGANDSRFLAMLRDLVKTCANDFLTTEDFKTHVEKHMTPNMGLRGDKKMDWFFDQWVNGTQLPHYTLDYKITKNNKGEHQAELKVKQSQVSDDFVMVVPVYGQFGDRTIRICQVRIEGNTETQSIKVPLPEKPKKLLLCAWNDVLCEVK
jgi:hypothetical protein